MTTTDHARAHSSKRERLRLLLWDLRWHDHHELRRAGGVRYSARLLELKRLGYAVKDEPCTIGHGKRYRMVDHRQGAPKEKQVKVFLSEDQAQDVCNGYLSPAVQGVVDDALRSFRNNREKL